MRLQKRLKSILLVASFLFFFQVLAYSARSVFLEEAVCNTAGPFGIMLPPILLGILLVGTWGGLSLLWWKHRNEDYSFVWLILLSAGLSNIVERLLHGCVFDYIAFPWWPVFNGADVALFVSVVFLVWRELRRPA